MDTKNYFHILRKRLITLGVSPSDARKVSRDFDRQIKAQGIYNALAYYKRVGETLIGHISQSGYVAPWVKTHDGFPTKLLCLKKYDNVVLLRVAKMARALELSAPTEQQVQKLRDAAESPFNGTEESQQELSRLIRRGIKLCDFQKSEFPKGFKSVFSQARTFSSRSVPTGTSVGVDIENILGVFHQWSSLIQGIPGWEQAIYPLHPSYLTRFSSTVEPFPFCGEIGGVMENGGKLRLFAAPSVLLQSLLEPLQVWLDSFRNQLRSDVFRDQISGALWAQENMKLGQKVQSIDLSAATCRFPFPVQQMLCKELGAPDWALDLYTEVSRRDWQCQPHMTEWLGTPTLKWQVGQPLGVNPSMSSFALCHNLLLVGLADELGLDINDSFRVLGDDVVTSNPDLASRYRELISALGIKISEHKSFNSKEYGEFAGFSITPTDLVRPGRWRIASWMNIHGLVKDLGAHVIDELRQDQQLLERILAFSQGTFDPPDQEWSSWLKLSSLVVSTNLVDLQYKAREVSWYYGCCKWLSSQLPRVSFQPAKDRSFVSLLREIAPAPLQKKVLEWSDSYRLFGDFLSPSTLLCQVEQMAKDELSFAELVTFIDSLKAEYEEYCWSLPKTQGRLSRDRREVLSNALNSVLEEAR